MINAVVFDFDGLILDTETPIFRSWADAYTECGIAPLTILEWADAIGTAGGLDPLAELQRRLAGGVLDGGVLDGGVLDGGVLDGGVLDGGVLDGGVLDGGVLDGGVLDGGVLDGGVLDGGVLDGGVLDGGVLDGGVLDGGVLDGGVLDDVLARRKARRDDLLAAEAVLPGVEDWLDSARQLGLAVGLASSSSLDWVESHLRRLGLLSRFQAIACFPGLPGAAGVPGAGGAGVAPHDGGGAPVGSPQPRMRPKPAPDLYLAVCTALGTAPGQALAVEDSPNGIQAARAAGMRCVAVPNPMTRLLDLGGADVVVDSLADIGLAEVLSALA